MLKIRLKKFGRHKHPTYRLVVQDSRTRRDGPAVEILGWYDPTRKSENLKFDLERVNYWLSKGAQATEKAAALIKKAGIPVSASKEAPDQVGAERGAAVQPAESSGDENAG